MSVECSWTVVISSSHPFAPMGNRISGPDMDRINELAVEVVRLAIETRNGMLYMQNVVPNHGSLVISHDLLKKQKGLLFGLYQFIKPGGSQRRI